MNGSIANGSRRSTPCDPACAAVVSDASVAAMYTPSLQSAASVTSGTVVDRRPPNTKASIATPIGFSQSGSIDGHCAAATVEGEFGGAALRPSAAALCGVQSRPCQSRQWAGGEHLPSHQTSWSSVNATLVKIT